MKNMRFNHQKTWNIIDEWPQMGDLTKKQCDLLKDFGFRQRNGRQHFFLETTLDLPTMIGGPRNRKWQRCKHRIGKVTRKWWGFGSNMGYPHMRTLGWHSTHPTNAGKPTSRHNQLPDMVKTLQRSQIVLKKNPVAGRLVCNFFAPGRRFKRTWTLWSTRPGNTEPSWGHCSINSMDPRLAASNKMYPLEWWRTRSLDWFSWEILKETTCFWWGKSWVSCRFSQVNPWNTTLWCGTWLNL